MHLSTHAVRRPIATTMLLGAAVLLGLVALPRLEVTLLPEVRSGALLVWIGYPEAGVPEIEEAVARPTEEALLGVSGVRSVRTRIVSGGATFRAELHPGIDPDLAALGLRERLDGIRWSFPAGVERPLVLGGAGEETPVQVLALAADDLEGAADWAETVLRPRLEQIDGVAKAEIVGAPAREIRIVPDPDRLRAAGFGVADLSRAVADANVDTPGGTLQRRGIRYALQVESRLTGAVDVADVVIAPADGRALRIGDVAQVVDGFEDAQGLVRLDGDPAVGVLLYRRAGANLLQVASGVREELARVEEEFPRLRLAIVADSSPFVRESIDGVWQAVWLGGLLAFVVLFAFLRDVRSPLFLALALPVSVITTFAALAALGTSLNLMSLGGIALGVGMLVDNGIVALENIHRLRGRGLAPAEAAAQGAREISLPILASTLTTCAVFVPLAFVPGTVGALFRDQAIAVGVSLLVSYVVALTLLPLLVARFPGPADAEIRRPLFGAYQRALRACLSHPRSFALLVAGALAVSAFTIVRLPREVIPEVATDHLELRLRLPAGRGVEAMQAASDRVESWLAERDGVLSVLAIVGDVGSLERSDDVRRANRATVRAVLDGVNPRERRELQSALRDAFAAEAELRIEVVPDAPELAAILHGGQATLTCHVLGPDDERAETVARDVADRAGLEDLQLVASEREPRIRLVPKEEALWRYGLTESEVLPAVEALATGVEATRLRVFDDEIPVSIRFAGAPDPRTADLLVGSRSFPTLDLFEVVTELAPATVWREDQARVASIRWDGPLADVQRARTALTRALEESELPPGYSAVFGGAWREMQETLGGILRAFALSAGLVLLVLAAQFESLRLPLLIFAAVPLSLVGVALALVPFGGTVNVMSGIGMVVLVGLVVNDSILKVDLLRRFRAEGRSRREAIELAGERRYRPIVMTTLTTVLGLAPLFLGRGAELRAPLAATIIGGLSVATILTLLVIPVLFERITGAFAEEGATGAFPSTADGEAT